MNLDDDARPKKKKPPARRNPEARREQNRIAARSYRQKRKQKLEILDRILDEGTDRPTQQHVVSTRTPKPDTGHSGSASSSDVDPFLLSHASLLTDQSQSSTQSHPSLGALGRPTSAPDSSVSAILDSIQHLSTTQKADLIQRLHNSVSAPLLDTADPTLSDATHSTNNWVSARPPQGPVQTRLQLEARRFAAFISRHVSGQVGPAQLSRIYAAEAGLFGAIFANCYALGMTDVEPVMVDDGASVFCPGPDTGHDPSQLSIVRSSFAGITSDLQPCDIQLTFGHHPYLDVLPWASFRQKALEAIRQEPPLLDEDELCRDICTGGLICWGAQQNSMGMEAGVPWDMRSWEAAVWFMNKYSFLVGDWNGEMWRGVRWWHNVRGERLVT